MTLVDACALVALVGMIAYAVFGGADFGAGIWDLFARLVDYDPRPALERIRVPVLALFGAEDRVTPVEESVAVYQAAVRSELLTVRVFEGGDHRVLAGDPPLPVDGYLDVLSTFVEEAAAARRM